MLKADKRINFGKVRMVMSAANEAEFTRVADPDREQAGRRRDRPGKDVTNGNGSKWRRRRPLGDQHHAAGGRSAGAADHLHGGDADPADGTGRRSPAEGGAGHTASATEQNQLVITVKTDGVYLNTQKMADVKALRDAIARQMVSRPLDQRVVFINSEDNLSFDRAVQAMDAAHEAGAGRWGS